MRATLIAAPIDAAPAWGKVLIAGGMGVGNAPALSTTELYDPAANSFVAAADTATMNTGRYFATATLLASGKVLIAGGETAGPTIDAVLSSTELYDPATNTFAPVSDTATMNTARVFATATLLPSGKVLIAGGLGSGESTILSSTELYDPATNSFAPAANTATMNSARFLATATLLTSGKVLIAGGSGGAFLTSTELYDPATNAFAPSADTAVMNFRRAEATATLLASGKVLIAGGNNGEFFLTSTELYDPATNTFAYLGDTATMNAGRILATATLLPSGEVLIAGGCCTLSSTELYDPATNSFAAAADRSHERQSLQRDGDAFTLRKGANR